MRVLLMMLSGSALQRADILWCHALSMIICFTFGVQVAGCVELSIAQEIGASNVWGIRLITSSHQRLLHTSAEGFAATRRDRCEGEQRYAMAMLLDQFVDS